MAYKTLTAQELMELAQNESAMEILKRVSPFIASGAGGYIRQDSTGTIAKESGGNLAAIAGAVESTVRKSSGLTALATTDDTVVEAIAADAVNTLHYVEFTNEGSVAGFYSVDGGTTWGRLPAETKFTVGPMKIANKAIQIKRIAGGSNLSGVYVKGW